MIITTDTPMTIQVGTRFQAPNGHIITVTAISIFFTQGEFGPIAFTITVTFVGEKHIFTANGFFEFVKNCSYLG